MDPRFCFLLLIKQNCLQKNFSQNANFHDPGIYLLLFLLGLAFASRTYLKLHNIQVTPKLVRKILINLDLSKVSGPNCIPVVVLKKCEPEL